MIHGHTVTVRREIAASAEDLFDAWLDARSLGTWLRPSAIRETRAETDPRVGGAFRIVMVDDASSIVHSGTYREIDRPHRLVFTWSSPATRFRDSLVTVTFRPSSGSTVVEIHQVGLPDEEARASHHAGWSDILRELDHHTINDETKD
ncbi:SRPBCC domain-containing protein [Actinomadura viridis]|uniref:SRPBCC family protein n=1 Tax=Actinomadura viridis TaxID=58110 RepID=UPI0036CF6664